MVDRNGHDIAREQSSSSTGRLGFSIVPTRVSAWADLFAGKTHLLSTKPLVAPGDPVDMLIKVVGILVHFDDGKQKIQQPVAPAIISGCGRKGSSSVNISMTPFLFGLLPTVCLVGALLSQWRHVDFRI
jgi:hypothetical protein